MDEYYDNDELGDSGLSPEDYSAISESLRENYSAALADLNDRMSAYEADHAYAEGAQSVLDQAEAQVAADEQAESDWQESMQSLATKLGRPISQSQAEKIE